jgi:hypothetical protein
VRDFLVLRALPVYVDILLLKDRFGHCKRPVKKVFDLAKAGYLFPLRRGHYLNLSSDDYRDVSLEYLANSLYGPSYISLEWALDHYSLIPERVERVTSVTTRPAWSVETPLGFFSYEHLNRNRYPCGYGVAANSNVKFFIATPEKALIDLVSLRTRSNKWSAATNIEQFLHEDLRLDTEHFFEIASAEFLRELLPDYNRNSKEARLIKWLLSKFN